MDSSPPAPPEPTPSYERLDSLGAQVDALDRLIRLARVSMRVFDIDLSEMGWDSVPRSEALTAFLRTSRNARLDIIVHDSRYLESRCARLQALRRTYGHAINLCTTGPEARIARDPLVIVDARHYLHRFDFEQPRAALALDDPEGATPLIQRFDEIWASGAPVLPGTVLGL